MSYDVGRSRDRLSVGTEIFKRSSDTFNYNHQNTWCGTGTVRPSILKNTRLIFYHIYLIGWVYISIIPHHYVYTLSSIF